MPVHVPGWDWNQKRIDGVDLLEPKRVHRTLV